MRPFHLALPVHSLEQARRFYGGLLGCAEGRSADRWVDFDFFGHQLSLHLADTEETTARNEVDGDEVPARHFGLVLEWGAWEALADRLTQAKVTFRIAPRVRFQGQPGEQGTFFLDDPSGNALEMKAFRDLRAMFATE